MGWTDGTIKSWDTERLKFAPILAVSEILAKATNNRYRVTDFDSDDDLIEVPESFRRLAEYTYSFPDITDIEALATIDRYVVGRWGCDDEETPGNPYVSPFVNYTVRDDFNDVDETPTVWTKAAILNELNKAEYIRINKEQTFKIDFPGSPDFKSDITKFVPLLAEWANQIYQMLNLFRWTVADLNWPVPGPTLKDYKIKESNGADYATAAANWPANFSDSTEFDATDRAATEKNAFGTTELLRRWSVDSLHNYYSNTSVLKHEADVYPYVDGYLDGFEDHGDDVTEDTYCFIGTYNLTQNVVPWSLNDQKTTKFVETVPNDITGTGTKGWLFDINKGFALVKWDVTDGFEYVTEV